MQRSGGNYGQSIMVITVGMVTCPRLQKKKSNLWATHARLRPAPNGHYSRNDPKTLLWRILSVSFSFICYKILQFSLYYYRINSLICYYQGINMTYQLQYKQGVPQDQKKIEKFTFYAYVCELKVSFFIILFIVILGFCYHCLFTFISHYSYVYIYNSYFHHVYD